MIITPAVCLLLATGGLVIDRTDPWDSDRVIPAMSAPPAPLVLDHGDAWRASSRAPDPVVAAPGPRLGFDSSDPWSEGVTRPR